MGVLDLGAKITPGKPGPNFKGPIPWGTLKEGVENREKKEKIWPGAILRSK